VVGILTLADLPIQGRVALLKYTSAANLCMGPLFTRLCQLADSDSITEKGIPQARQDASAFAITAAAATSPSATRPRILVSAPKVSVVFFAEATVRRLRVGGRLLLTQAALRRLAVIWLLNGLLLSCRLPRWWLLRPRFSAHTSLHRFVAGHGPCSSNRALTHSGRSSSTPNSTARSPNDSTANFTPPCGASDDSAPGFACTDDASRGPPGFPTAHPQWHETPSATTAMARKVIKVDRDGGGKHDGSLVQGHARLVAASAHSLSIGPSPLARPGDDMMFLCFFLESGGVHAQHVAASVGEDLPREPSETAIDRSDQSLIGPQQGKVPAQERFIDVGKLVKRRS